MKYISVLTMSCAILLHIYPGSGMNNGLARTPPMGWMQWERFRCNLNCTADPDNCISEKLFMQIADRMAEDGYRDVGYQYVNIDDCWMLPERGPDRRLQPDPARFPNGMKALADYVHSKGLKLGIYADMGTFTCKEYPGSKFYLQLDAETFANWGIDSLKLDCCYQWGGYDDLETGYDVMSFMLNRTGRPILFSCSAPVCGGTQTNFTKIVQICNSWRVYKDIQDRWTSVTDVIEYYGNNSAKLSEIAGPGAWNDPDQLIIGDYSLSTDQQRTQMGMWAMFAAPLFMSVDLRHMKPEASALLLNKRVIAINQDHGGVQARRILNDKVNFLQIWTKPLFGPVFKMGSFAVAYFCTAEWAGPIKVQRRLKDLGISQYSMYEVTEVFDGKPLGTLNLTSYFSVEVNPTGIYMFTAVPSSTLYYP